MPDKIPFGPGHPVFDKQLDLFENHDEHAPASWIEQKNAQPVSKTSKGNVKLLQIPGYWECLDSGLIVKAGTEEQAVKKLGKGRRVAPANFEHGGYC